MEGFPGELGAHLERAEGGNARLTFHAREKHLNQAGKLHGGVLATLVDAAMGQAARSTTGEQEVPATTQLSIAFLDAGREGPMVATAQVRKHGENILLCDAEVDQEGRTLVHAVATFAVLRR